MSGKYPKAVVERLGIDPDYLPDVPWPTCSAKQTQEALGCGKFIYYRLIADGSLRSEMIGGTRQDLTEDVLNIVAQRVQLLMGEGAQR